MLLWLVLYLLITFLKNVDVKLYCHRRTILNLRVIRCFSPIIG
jgi:hypothetical protein